MRTVTWFKGYSAKHGTDHKVHILALAGQATLLCETCETSQTVDSIEAHGVAFVDDEGDLIAPGEGNEGGDE